MVNKSQKSKAELNLFDRIVIPRNIFLYKLSIQEVRLCVLVTSDRSINKNTIKYNEKLYILGGNKHKLKYINYYFENLISLGLISEDGSGLKLTENNIESFILNPNEYYQAKTIREIFGLCVKVWKGKKSMGFAYIKEEELEALFTKRYLTTYLKNTNNGLKKFGFYLIYEKTRNGFNKFKIQEFRKCSEHEEATITLCGNDDLKDSEKNVFEHKKEENFDFLPKISSKNTDVPLLPSFFNIDDIDNL